MPSLAEVKTYLAQQQLEVWDSPQPTPTAATAAVAAGCSVAEIAKTLLFLVSGQPIIVVTCGDMKVKSSSLKQASRLSGRVKLPEADQVLQLTGYLPGGVCPFLLPEMLPVLLDNSLQRFPLVYAAGGDDFSLVPVTAAQLETLTAGCWVEVCAPI